MIDAPIRCYLYNYIIMLIIILLYPCLHYYFQQYRHSSGLVLCLLAIPIIERGYIDAIPLENFYPYGTDSGDQSLGKIDDGFGPTYGAPIMVCYYNILL